MCYLSLSALCQASRDSAASLGRSSLQVLRSLKQAYGPLALGIAVAVIIAATAGTATATDPTASEPAFYNGLGVTVTNTFPLVVTALGGALFPMIVFSIALALIYFIWSFARSKAFGSA